MSIIDIRKELHNYIDNSTDDIVAAVYAMLKTYNREGSSVKNIEAYNAEIDEAMQVMDDGVFDVHDDVKKALLK